MKLPDRSRRRPPAGYAQTLRHRLREHRPLVERGRRSPDVARAAHFGRRSEASAPPKGIGSDAFFVVARLDCRVCRALCQGVRQFQFKIYSDFNKLANTVFFRLLTFPAIFCHTSAAKLQEKELIAANTSAAKSRASSAVVMYLPTSILAWQQPKSRRLKFTLKQQKRESTRGPEKMNR